MNLFPIKNITCVQNKKFQNSCNKNFSNMLFIKGVFLKTIKKKDKNQKCTNKVFIYLFVCVSNNHMYFFNVDAYRENSKNFKNKFVSFLIKSFYSLFLLTIYISNKFKKPTLCSNPLCFYFMNIITLFLRFTAKSLK